MSSGKAEGIPVLVPEGLPGFEEIHRYTIKEVPGNPMFFWLESEKGPNFLLTKPGFFFPDYKVAIKEELLLEIAKQTEDVEVYTIATVPAEPVEMTANLLAPLLFNKKQGVARQVILHDSPYSTRHPLFPPEKRRSCI